MRLNVLISIILLSMLTISLQSPAAEAPKAAPAPTATPSTSAASKAEEIAKLKQQLQEQLDKVKGLKKEAPAAAPAKKAKEIVLAAVIDKSGNLKQYGRFIAQTLNVIFKEQNNAGGINGTPVKLLEVDHEYSASVAFKKVKQTVDEGKTDVFFAYIGVEHLDAVRDLLEENKIAVIFPFSAAESFRKPGHKGYKNIINLRASYSEEATALTEYAVKTLAKKRVAIFAENSIFGKEATNITLDILKANGLTEKEWISTWYKTDSTEVEDAAKKITEFKPDTLLFYTTPKAAIELVKQVGMTVLSDTALLSITTAEIDFKDFVEEQGSTLILARTLPDPQRSKLPIIKEFTTLMKKEGLDNKGILSTNGFELYLLTQLLFEAIKNVQGDVTKDKIIKEIESWNNKKFKGLTLTFNPVTRSFFKDTWIDIGKSKDLIHIVKTFPDQKDE